ncbi:SLAM family member 9-like [Danio aesculapii]|uniref:SLAM family member 9-like n=1 Tax=Danio aesculapii TaxID=1142201 RepID=UPI0024BF9D9D|nr:SLAM family member 9-like [Danio aesculapii]
MHINVVCVCGVEVKSVSVTEGDSVTLESALAEIQSKDMIMWRFGPQDFLLAKISRDDNKGENFGDVTDEKSRDRLKLDNQTGSLTITNSRISDSGLYTVSSRTKGDTPLHTFNLTVYAHLPVPVLIITSSQSSSSVQYCSVLCSVVNVSTVSLSWYKGNSVLNSTSVSDLSISLSLPLEIDCLDDSYSCVVNNPISNQTTHLNLCQPCLDCICCYGSTEAGIRLALSAVVAVATVAVLFCDIRSRSHQKRVN